MKQAVIGAVAASTAIAPTPLLAARLFVGHQTSLMHGWVPITLQAFTAVLVLAVAPLAGAMAAGGRRCGSRGGWSRQRPGAALTVGVDRIDRWRGSATGEGACRACHPGAGPGALLHAAGVRSRSGS